MGLGSVHLPHTPPYTYTDGTPIKGEYPSAHMDVLYELDKVVGSFVSTIEDNGLARDTVIIFTSDNGGLPWDTNFFHHSSGKYIIYDELKGIFVLDGHTHRFYTILLTIKIGPLRGHKGQIWEGGHRVPMIIRYPFFPKGEKRRQLIGLNDLYATICELVGIDIPRGSAEDSVSFAKLLYSENNLEDARTSLATWDYKGGILEAEAIRSNNLKLIRHVNPPKIEMFDLGSDVSEANDISRFIPSYLKDKMLADLTKMGPCPDDDDGYFRLSNGQSVTCSFFRTNSEERCIRYAEGASKCNSICGPHKKMCKDTLESVWG